MIEHSILNKYSTDCIDWNQAAETLNSIIE
jgi:hypothetical protein